MVSEDQIEKKKDDSGKAAVWGVGGVFPQREEKRGLGKKEKEKQPEQDDDGKKLSAPAEMEWTASERQDPFSASTSGAGPQEEEEVNSPTDSASPPHSEASTAYEEPSHEEPSHEEPFHEEKSGGGEEDHGQVGGELPQDGEWEDEMEKTDGDPPVHTWWGSMRFAFREPLAEFLGMLIVIALGIGANCQVKLSQDNVS